MAGSQRKSIRRSRQFLVAVACCLMASGLFARTRVEARSADRFASTAAALAARAIDPVSVDALRQHGHARVIVNLGAGVEGAAFAAATAPGTPLAGTDAPTTARVNGDRMRQLLADAKQPVISAIAPFTSNRRDYPNLGAFTVTVNSEQDLVRLASTPGVARVDPDEMNRHSLFGSLPSIGQEIAVAAGYTGAGTYVAIIDTGAEYGRAAFGSCVAPGYPSTCRVAEAPPDFSTQDDGISVYDDLQRDDHCDVLHGTNVSAIAAATAPQTKLIVEDVFEWVDPDTGSALPPCTPRAVSIAWTVDVLRAVDWLIGRKLAGVNVVAANLSLGGTARFTTACSDTHHFSALIAAGIQPIVAAGNAAQLQYGGAFLGDGVSRPACISGAIPVGATDNYSNAMWFSQSGPFPNMLWAPGSNITAGELTLSGTSMAAPHVAGAFAAASQAMPGSTLQQRIDVLRDSGTLVFATTILRPERRINMRLMTPLLAPVPNDNRADATVLVTTGTELTRVMEMAYRATVEPGEADVGGSPAARTVWFRHTMTKNGSFAVGNGHSRLAIYGGTSRACTMTMMSGLPNCVQVEAYAGQVLEIVASDPTWEYTHDFQAAEGPVEGDDITSAPTYLADSASFDIPIDTTYTTSSTWDRYAPGATGARTYYVYIRVPTGYRDGLRYDYRPIRGERAPDIVVDGWDGRMAARNRREGLVAGPSVNPYRVMISSDSPAVGVLTVSRQSADITNDTSSTPVELAVPSGMLRLPTAGANPGARDLGTLDHDLWYRFAAPANGRLLLTTDGSNVDTALCVRKAGAVQSVCAGDQTPNDAGLSELSLDVTDGEIFEIQAGVPAGGIGEGLLSLSWRFQDQRTATAGATGPSTTVTRSTVAPAPTIATSGRRAAPDAPSHA